MKTLKQFMIIEDVTPSMFKNIEKFADRLFAELDIDVAFTKHFKDRVNDDRNHPKITGTELVDFFREAFKKHGKQIKARGEGLDGILQQITHNLNLPFILQWDKRNNELDLVAKTIMRTKKFFGQHGQKVMRF